MTFTYYKAPASVQRGHTCPHHAGTFMEFLTHSAPQGIAILTPLSGQAGTIARKPTASYVLQKDPDGSWFIDRCGHDTGAEIRPIPARLNDGYRAPASDDAAYFIIEIG